MEPSGPLTYGELIIDADAWEVRLRGDIVELTKTEFEILVALASRPRSVVTEEELTLLVWGESWFGDDGNLAVHVSKLRAKLGESGTNPRYIRTVRGVGYRFYPGREGHPDGMNEAYRRLSQHQDAVRGVMTADLVIVEVETQRDDVLGWATAELVGRFVPWLETEALREPGVARRDVKEQVARGVTAVSGKNAVRHLDGRVVQADFATHVLFDVDGGVSAIHFVLVVLDDDDSGTGHG